MYSCQPKSIIIYLQQFIQVADEPNKHPDKSFPVFLFWTIIGLREAKLQKGVGGFLVH